MNLNAKTILNHKVVAVVNLLWAIFHIWIAITVNVKNILKNCNILMLSYINYNKKYFNRYTKRKKL